MSSVPSLGIQEKANTPHQAFVTTGVFDTAIFSYTTGTTLTNGQIITTGVLTALNSSDIGSYNAAGTVLRVNGKKLIPDVHPITTGTKQYYVGVYHPVFGAGFINPNNPLFVPMTSDKANSLNTTANGYYLDADRGPGVYTTGSVTAGGPIYSTASSTLTGTGTVNIGSGINSYQAYVISIAGSLTLNADVIPAAGRQVTFIIVNATGSGQTVIFGSGIIDTTGGLTSTVNSAKTSVFTFVSDGTRLVQVSSAQNQS